MPSNYAHYRFGAQALPELPPEVRRTVNRFRDLYDVGLHGPDLFFYYNPLVSTKTGALGSAYHRLSGGEFFGRCARRLRLEPSEAGSAYLYGVLGHYCLDSLCHPQVKLWHDTGRAGHVEIEVELDRYLLELDGKTPAHTQDLSAHLHLGPGGWETIAAFYPPAKPGQIRLALGNRIRVTRLLAAPDGPRRRIVEKGMGLAGPGNAQMLMLDQANPHCDWAPGELMPLYDQALANFPEMARELYSHLTRGTPLGALFTEPFG